MTANTPPAYLWQRLFQPDAWLKVLGRFLHLQKSVKEDSTARGHQGNLIFPRYHQWEVVNS
jgi:type I restriction enzyme R subunit